MFKTIKGLFAVLSIVRFFYGFWQKWKIKSEALAEIRKERKLLSEAQLEESKKIDNKPVSNNKHDIINGL